MIELNRIDQMNVKIGEWLIKLKWWWWWFEMDKLPEQIFWLIKLKSFSFYGKFLCGQFQFIEAIFFSGKISTNDYSSKNSLVAISAKFFCFQKKTKKKKQKIASLLMEESQERNKKPSSYVMTFKWLMFIWLMYLKHCIMIIIWIRIRQRKLNPQPKTK